MKQYELRYGCNPHQDIANVSLDSDLPFSILNGSPGYINLLDALNSWQLVRELKTLFKLPSAASFKHVSPAGAAISIPLSEELKKAYFIEDMELSDLAVAYARARGADRMSSFGDWVALSEVVDIHTAKLISREVSDGIIAPGYDDDALEILKKKKSGNYNILLIDSNYEPKEMENREVFGVRFSQRRNDVSINESMLNEVITENKVISAAARRDLLLALVVTKYTQSNSVVYSLDGQTIGIGAGQQSRIHCTRLAGNKSDHWHLRKHPKVLGLKFKPTLKRPERDNLVDQFLSGELTTVEQKYFYDGFEEVPERLTHEEKEAWMSELKEVCLSSDAFFPFRDNIDRAYASGVRYIVQPGGSVRDDSVVTACNEHGIVMAYSGIRLFHH